MKLLLGPPPPESQGSLRLTDPQPFPEDPEAWMTALLTQSLATGMALGAMQRQPLDSACGWPMQLAQTEVVDVHGNVCEVRLAAFYRFLDFCAAAVVCGLSPAALAAERTALVTLLRSATPRWEGQAPVALIDLWR